jgi:MFS family permease
MIDSASGGGSNDIQNRQRPWFYELNRYQWFVFLICTLGWVFDCMDQQLFNVVRKPAVAGLLGLAPDNPKVAEYSGYATALILIGWATGGIFFGILGDKLGRAKTMVATILVYSIFTGVSGLAGNIWEFILYRFLCGLGVGGQFAVGVALVAEYMPDHVRPRALAFLQAMANLGNVTAALVNIGFGQLEQSSFIHEGWSWRLTLAIGTLPALLAIPVFRSLKEPESWKKAVGEGGKRKQAGSLKELFTNPRWRRNTIVGMILASTGVIGLWGIGFFSVDLNQSVFRKSYENTERQNGEAEKDRQYISMILASPSEAAEFIPKTQSKNLLSEQAGQKDARQVYDAILDINQEKQEINKENIVSQVEKKYPLPASEAQERQKRLETYLTPVTDKNVRSPASTGTDSGFQDHVDRISDRAKKLNGQVSFWAGLTSILFNIGGFCGAYGFSYITARVGRRWAFAISFLAAGISTSMAFLFMNDAISVLWMTPLMGGCIFLIFGGYAVYFPELYPTRLRSTGTSFCYNIGRYVAAIGPITLGLLSSQVFVNYPEPMRYAGATMCTIFVVGMLALPFAPETKDQALPE